MNVATHKYVTEFIGTFFLVLTIGFTDMALAIASMLMVMIYAGGHISGGHYNPAVTLGVWLRGGLGSDQVAPYMGSQIVGAIVAALLINFFRNNAIVPELAINVPYAFIAEFLFTFALVYVVLNAAVSRDTAGNSFYGLAIGFTVLAGAFAVGSISGAAFNPAVAVGIAVMKTLAWKNIWIYFAANLLGGAVAAYTFLFLNPHDR